MPDRRCKDRHWLLISMCNSMLKSWLPSIVLLLLSLFEQAKIAIEHQHNKACRGRSCERWKSRRLRTSRTEPRRCDGTYCSSSRCILCNRSDLVLGWKSTFRLPNETWLLLQWMVFNTFGPIAFAVELSHGWSDITLAMMAAVGSASFIGQI